jgi:hypothetical protein
MFTQNGGSHELAPKRLKITLVVGFLVSVFSLEAWSYLDSSSRF